MRTALCRELVEPRVRLLDRPCSLPSRIAGWALRSTPLEASSRALRSTRNDGWALRSTPKIRSRALRSTRCDGWALRSTPMLRSRALRSTRIGLGDAGRCRLGLLPPRQCVIAGGGWGPWWGCTLRNSTAGRRWGGGSWQLASVVPLGPPVWRSLLWPQRSPCGKDTVKEN